MGDWGAWLPGPTSRIGNSWLFLPKRGPAMVLTQSTMRILLTLSLCWSCLAAMATELKKQKPLFGKTARERERDRITIWTLGASKAGPLTQAVRISYLMLICSSSKTASHTRTQNSSHFRERHETTKKELIATQLPLSTKNDKSVNRWQEVRQLSSEK